MNTTESIGWFPRLFIHQFTRQDFWYTGCILQTNSADTSCIVTVGLLKEYLLGRSLLSSKISDYLVVCLWKTIFLSWIPQNISHLNTWLLTWQTATVKFTNQIMAMASIFAGLGGTFINIHGTVFVWKKRKLNIKAINHAGFGKAEKLLHSARDKCII